MLRREVSAAVKVTDWGRAEAALARLTWYRPDDLEAIRLRVGIAEQRGDLAAAARALAAVPDSVPESPSAHVRRGLILKELYRAREAEAAFRAALRLAPRLPEPRRELVALLGIERRADEQEKELWELHDRAGCPIEALRLLAQSTVIIPPGTLAKTSDEGAVLERCLAADPDDSHLRPPLARFYRLRGETDAARRLLESWLRDHPDDPSARVEWLACLARRGRCRRGLALVRVPTLILPRIRGLRATPRGLVEPPGKIRPRPYRLTARRCGWPLANRRCGTDWPRPSARRAGWTRPPRPWRTIVASRTSPSWPPVSPRIIPLSTDSMRSDGSAGRWAANARHAPGSPRRFELDPANAEARAALGSPGVHPTGGESPRSPPAGGAS